ncbi:hypothetical protein KKO72_16105, partial [Rhodoferax sp. U11-2br]|nr:hypothetical protein [Rhodoferax sp. U11-2br]
GQALSMAQRPPRDITPRAQSLGHKAAAAQTPKKLGGSVKAPASQATATKPALSNTPAPAKAAAGADSDWESF